MSKYKDDIVKAIDKLREEFGGRMTEVVDLACRADATLEAVTGGKIQEIKRCVVSVSSGVESNIRNAQYGAHEAVATKLLEAIKANRELNESIHQENLPKIAMNKAVRGSIENFMNAINMPRMRTVQRSVRGRLKYENESMGWTNDLHSIHIDDGYDSAVRSLDDIEKRVTQTIETIRREKEAEKRKVAEAQAKAQKLRGLVNIALKYKGDTPIHSASSLEDPYFVLDLILKQNKYLYLAHYLEKNRNDWSDGPDYAECGLNGFDIETEEDGNIHDCIQGLIDDWEGDGRVFRDCEYNYSYLFAKVFDTAPELLEDYNRTKELIDD